MQSIKATNKIQAQVQCNNTKVKPQMEPDLKQCNGDMHRCDDPDSAFENRHRIRHSYSNADDPNAESGLPELITH